MSTAGISAASLPRVPFTVAVLSGIPISCLSVMVASTLSAYGDLPRAGGLAALNGDLQHSVAVLGIDALRIYILGKGDHAPEVSVEALPPVVLRFLLSVDPAASGDGQQILLDGHVKGLRIQSSSEQVHIDAFRGRADVDGRESAPLYCANACGPRGVPVKLARLTLQASELLEWVGIEIE